MRGKEGKDKTQKGWERKGKDAIEDSEGVEGKEKEEVKSARV